MPSHHWNPNTLVFSFLHCDWRSRLSDREPAFCFCIGVGGGDESDKLRKVHFSGDVNLRILFSRACLAPFDYYQQGAVHWLAEWDIGGCISSSSAQTYTIIANWRHDGAFWNG